MASYAVTDASTKAMAKAELPGPSSMHTAVARPVVKAVWLEGMPPELHSRAQFHFPLCRKKTMALRACAKLKQQIAAMRGPLRNPFMEYMQFGASPHKPCPAPTMTRRSSLNCVLHERRGWVEMLDWRVPRACAIFASLLTCISQVELRAQQQRADASAAASAQFYEEEKRGTRAAEDAAQQ